MFGLLEELLPFHGTQCGTLVLFLQGRMCPCPSGDVQQDLDAVHMKAVPQSHSSPSSTKPFPHTLTLTGRRHFSLDGSLTIWETDSLVQGDIIWWFSLCPSFENLDMRKRPLKCLSRGVQSGRSSGSGSCFAPMAWRIS